MRRWLAFLALFELACLACMAACGSVSPYTKEPFDVRYQRDLDRYPVDVPEESYYNGYWEYIEVRGTRRIYNFIDLPAHLRWTGNRLNAVDPKEAENVNTWDEVPDSTWFTNRIGRRPLERSELLRLHDPGPDMNGPWTIIAGKESGVTSGFTIRDQTGQMYFIKFDPRNLDGLVTSSEIVSTLIMNAAGYNVPYNHLRYVRPERFVLGEGALIPGEYQVPRKMTSDDISMIFSKVECQPDGTFRLVASKALAGKPVGPFSFEGTRADDPNDRIPHEHRRELRGAHIISAWINNVDIRTKNSLDMYVGEPGRGYLQHNLLDFGSTLGSRGGHPKSLKDGYADFLDTTEVLKYLGTAGLRTPYWKNKKLSGFASVGLFESKTFDPRKWAPWLRNPAWDALTERDAFWATRIIIQFSDEQIATIVRAARYPEDEAAEYVTRTLIERRDKIAAAWLSSVTPLDSFRIVDHGSGKAPSLVFEDLAVMHGVAGAPARSHQYSIESDRYDETSGLLAEPVGSIPGRYRIELGAYSQGEPDHLRISLTVEQDGKAVGRGVDLFVYCWTSERCLITGLERK